MSELGNISLDDHEDCLISRNVAFLTAWLSFVLNQGFGPVVDHRIYRDFYLSPPFRCNCNMPTISVSNIPQIWALNSMVLHSDLTEIRDFRVRRYSV
jgi:hypothetical protein